MDEDEEVLDIDAAVGLDGAKEEDEMDGFHEVDPVTGSPVVDAVTTDDDDEDEDEDLIVNA